MKQLQFDFTSNLGGVCRMFAIPVSSFKNIRKDYSAGLNYLQVINKDDIIDIYLTEDSALFKETPEKGGYRIEISGVVPKSNPINVPIIQVLESKFWFVLFQDNNGFTRLAGMVENQLMFTKTDTTGSYSNRNQLDFIFSAVQKKSCLFIELAEMDDL